MNSAVDPAFPLLDGVEHRFIDLPGLRMHVAEAGSGDPVLLLHGFPQHWWEWRKVIPHLAEHYRVICPDLRGSGWTEAPSKGYTREQLLADVVALLDSLQLDQVRVLAHDWGSLVAFQLCLKHPGRVQQHLSMGIPHPYVRFHARLLRGMHHAWYQLALITPIVGPRALSSGRQRFPRYLLNHFTSPGTWSGDDIEIFLTPLRDPARARAGQALYRGFITREAYRILAGKYRNTLATPTLVLIGADDPVVRPEFLGNFEQYAQALEVEVVDGASHFIVDEKPDVVTGRALEFFARQP